MNSTDRLNFLEVINSASIDGDIQQVVMYLNEYFSSNKYKEIIDLVYEAISLFQLYGFLSYFDEKEKECFLKSDVLRSQSYKGIKMDYYNRGQLSLIEEINNNEKVMISAPTSFGKTSIIIEYIIQNKTRLHNIIFVLPTNSLIEELYHKLLEYNKEVDLKYDITNQPNRFIGRQIFLLTPERFLMQYQIEKHNIYSTDLVVMDEMYKIRKENADIKDFLNDRSLRFRKVADIIAKCNRKVVYLSPYTYTDTKSMSLFMMKHDVKKINRTIEYVGKEIIDASKFVRPKDTKYKKAISLMYRLQEEKNIVYVSDRDTASKIVKNYFPIKEEFKGERIKAFYNHIKDNYVIDEFEWDVAEAIRKGIGIYIAPMPRYIKREIVSLYETNMLSTIIATTAFTEGVNCNAKNMILTSINTGRTLPLTQIDALNTIGRVGRFASESIGKVYCIDTDIYEKIKHYSQNQECILENENYLQGKEPRTDYELDMIENEYLTEKDISKKNKITIEMNQLGLSENDLNISLSVSKEWKIYLYRYFACNLTKEEVDIRREKMQVILRQQRGKEFLAAMEYIFRDIQKAFLENNISEYDIFPIRQGELPAFDKSGNFLWGRFYGNYVLGDVKKSILRNISYVMKRYEELSTNHLYTKKKEAESWFASNNSKWILGFLDKDLKPKYSKFYSEYFRFVSSIMQYKIPFYLTFYFSILKLYISKKYAEKLVGMDIQEKDIMIMFEEGELAKDYQPLTDYGIPMITINKFKKNDISMNEIKDRFEAIDELDAFEKMMLIDFYKTR